MNSPHPFVAPFLQHILLLQIPSHPSAGVPFPRIRRSVYIPLRWVLLVRWA